MRTLESWAIAWGIPAAALADLRTMMGAGFDPPVPPPANLRNEADVQAMVRLEATNLGGRLWRNNVGAGELSDGSFVRWGLANESKKMNALVKSSDLVGAIPRKIQPQHVGQTWAVFTCREVKAPGWRYAGTDRERAQLRWIELVQSIGGDAAFANGPGTIDGPVSGR